MKKLLTSKTLWAAVAAIVGAVGGYFTGDIEFGEMLQLVVTSALAVFLRHGVAKVEEKVT
jgi:VIT1/CCC1 family predicted Fe2+/Mn2+ transporter